MNAPALSPAASATLRKVYDALLERGCAPKLTADGRGLVADCPCCGEERGLTVQFPRTDEVPN